MLDVTNWTVTSQIPEAGTTLGKDAKITLFVHHDTDDAKPTENPTTEAPSTSDPKKDDVPREHRKALKTAENYSKRLHLSKQGIYDQLISEAEGFSPEAAQYAIDNIQADWNANALAKAKEYEKTLNMSDEAIREQLVSEYGEQFTQEEADYAISHLDD
ncbi:MAG: Ltp family lipoprotein [Isoptericola variabilis]|nr:Ltp family lipoprotein [Isoptericola variabilis]